MSWGGSNAHSAAGLAIDQDGQILLAGTTNFLIPSNNFDISYLNPDGTPGGEENYDLGGNDQANAIAIDYTGTAQTNPNYGKRILVGSSDNQLAVIRIDTDGSLDNTFNGDGKLLTQFTSQDDNSAAYGVTMLPNGNIVVVGSGGSTAVGNYDCDVMELNPDGTLDTNFGTNGVADIDLGTNSDAATRVLVGQTGDLLVGASAGGAGALVCLTSTGALDTAFGTGGTEQIDNSAVTGMALSPNHTFVTTGGYGNENFTVNRLFDRAPATVGIFSNDPVASEAGQVPATFQLHRQEALPYDTTVYYTVGGTATPPSTNPGSPDYTGIPALPSLRYIVIPAGQNFSAPIVITPIDDTIPEDDETVIITLQDDAGVYDVVGSPSVTLTILDNDRQISGIVYDDANSNGTQDTGETGLPLATVYVDTNNNGKFDAGEPNSVTNGIGQYFLGNLGTGTKIVRVVPPTGYRQTAPTPNSYTITLAAGDDIKNQNFGVTSNALITGTVFDDENANGVKDAGETPVDGWLLFADLNDYGTFDPGDPTATTDINGAYSFNTLAAGTYRIDQALQDSWVATTPLPNNYFNVTVASGQTSANHNFGNRLHSISGTVFDDLDRDGVQDPNESGVANVDVWIDTNGNGQFDPLPVIENIGGFLIQLPADAYAVTNGAGKYTITGVVTQAYTVHVQLPDGTYGQSLPLNNAPRSVSLVNSPIATGVNFGIYQGQVKLASTSITGSVFNDLNDNGVRDIENPTEPNNVGWLVWLDTNDNGILDPGEPSAITDAGGNFIFDNLQPGVTYHLSSAVPAGWVATTPTEFDITLSQDQSVDEQFGEMQEATISGNVFNDANANGVKDTGETGMTGVKVYLDTNQNGSFDPTETFTMTDGAGNYSFSVVPGTYVIREVLPTASKLVSPASGFFNQTVTAGQNVTGENFANAPTTDPASVTLQGETATLAGGTVAAHSNGGYTGTGYADFGGNASSAQWTTTRLAAGTVSLVFRYANGETTNRPLSAVVDGVTIGSIAFVPTGSWTTWKTVSINANLRAGSNTIKATATTSAGGANIDSMTINTVALYQAESATLAGGTVAAHTNTGYTGTGYADFGGTNSSATFTVTAGAAGSATLTFRHANGSTANRPLKVSVNGSVVGSLTFAPTGSWTTWATVTLNVNLLSGSNTIKLSVTGSDGPNLDWMSVG